MAKEIANIVNLVIPAGKASPAPPTGAILGQNGVPIQEFVQEFNAKTADMGDYDIPVIITVFKDRTFKLKFKQPTVVGMLKKQLKIEKGSGTPNKDKVAKVKKADLMPIAERKMPDFNTKNKKSALEIVAGVARSLGIEVID